MFNLKPFIFIFINHTDNNNFDICLKKICQFPVPILDVHMTSKKVTYSDVQMLNCILTSKLHVHFNMCNFTNSASYGSGHHRSPFKVLTNLEFCLVYCRSIHYYSS